MPDATEEKKAVGVDTKRRPRRELTEFGTEIHALMLKRGIRSLPELSERLKEVGCKVSRQSLSSYTNGTRKPPPSLPGQLVAALELDDEERIRLGIAFAYGQG